MNFDWINKEHRTWLVASGECNGADAIRELEGADTSGLRKALSRLIDLQNTTEPWRKLGRPRVFVSHRQVDEKRARVFERRIQTAKSYSYKFDTWLDVLDPQLAWITQNTLPDPQQQALAIAIQIELALLNCTHVLVVVTQRSSGSLWIPYEYGRVKCASMFSENATAWLCRSIHSGNDFAEYFRLGPIHKTRRDVDDWLDDEWKRWKASPIKAAARKRLP